MKAQRILLTLVGSCLWCQVACWWDGGRGANAYSAMSDIDWSKRDNWISPAYQFSSMADTDWGWKKRSPVAARMQQRQSGCTTTSPSSSENPKHSSHVIGNNDDNSVEDLSSWGRYYLPYRPIALASRRLPNRERAYSFHSMADQDWGWKRKKRTNSKRHLGSLGGIRFSPQRKMNARGNY